MCQLRRIVLMAAVALVYSGCASSAAPGSAAPPQPPDRLAQIENLPDRFTPEHEPYESEAKRECPPRYVDTDQGVVLRVLRSEVRTNTVEERSGARVERYAVGDYAVDTPEKYGLANGEALRIDCVSAKAIDVVLKF